ncbi:hypothetical protein Tco_1570039 [Tanacetum coccineum]
MEQMTTLRDLVDQVIQKKEEEKRIAEEQAAKEIPICYDDDEDNTIAITPVFTNRGTRELFNSMTVSILRGCGYRRMSDDHLRMLSSSALEVVRLLIRKLDRIDDVFF